MALPVLPLDFKDFLKLLNYKKIEYLLIGGYAVGYYGYPRATADMDIWIAVHEKNAKKVVEVIRNFGINSSKLDESIFLVVDKIIRIGNPPLRIELLTGISGVKFGNCYKRRKVVVMDGIKVNIISFQDLLKNKKASARHKDLNDLENLKKMK